MWCMLVLQEGSPGGQEVDSLKAQVSELKEKVREYRQEMRDMEEQHKKEVCTFLYKHGEHFFDVRSTLA